MDWNAVWSEVAGAAEWSWAILSSPLAQRLYVVLLSVAIVGLALVRARDRKGFLEGVTEDYFQVKYPGRAPSRPSSIRRRERQIRETQGRRAKAVWLALGELLLVGVVLPATLLALGTIHYSWFDAGAAPLLDEHSGLPIFQPSAAQVAGYVADHLLRGGLFDLMEVFKIHASTVTNNRDAYGYTVGLFLFHLYVEAFFLFGLIALGRMALVVPRALVRAPV